ncbi:MAG: HAD-IIIC family phosphatase [Burkholderiales bacterium]|nr:HAD-IIIC family phosphatase [Anaerolineae bacterium]
MSALLCSDLLSVIRSKDIPLFLSQFAVAAHTFSAPELGSIGYALQQQVQIGEARQNGFVATVDVSILSSSNAMELPNQLTAALAADWICPRVSDTGYNQWRFKMMNAGPITSNAGTHVTVCLLDESIIFDVIGLTDDIDLVEKKLAECSREIDSLVSHFLENNQSFLILNTPLLSKVQQDVLLDFRSKARLSHLWCRFNAELLALPQRYDRIFVIDSAVALQGYLPHGEFHDPRLTSVAKLHWTTDAIRGMANAQARAIRALLGLNKKCLVVDLDNTLWGGILGDDGIDALEVEEGDHGDAYAKFQQAVAALGRQGIILAICSKNDDANVRQCFAQRRMPLSLEDFSIVVANWEPKDRNIRHIVQTLNIGDDSVVFVDDSAFEAGLVAKHLPKTRVLHLDGDPALYVETLLRQGWFDRPSLTEEDRSRNKLYATEEKRTVLSASFSSMEDYLHDLNLQVRVFPVTAREVHRVAQLTQRTNQFNLTTIRLSESELSARISDPDMLNLAIEAQDRFGSYGVVGAVFGRRSGNSLTLENFVLSCRVFSRSIEHFVLSEVVDIARDMQCGRLVGHYLSSSKNQNFSNFYLDAGFSPIDADSDVRCYAHDVALMLSKPSWIRQGILS